MLQYSQHLRRGSRLTGVKVKEWYAFTVVIEGEIAAARKSPADNAPLALIFLAPFRGVDPLFPSRLLYNFR